ncbi:hypothetical protein ACLMJK_004503 [Lecanora helva]
MAAGDFNEDLHATVSDIDSPMTSGNSTLLQLPPGLKELRQRVFGGDNISWSAAEFNQNWHFMSNMWVPNQKRPKTKKNTQAQYWYCRLWRDSTERPREHTGVRVRRRRNVPSCPMRIKLIYRYNNCDDLEAVELRRYDNELAHNHSLDYIDSIKSNKALKAAASGIHDAIGGPDKHLLQVEEVLHQIEDRYNEISEAVAEWNPKIRQRVIDRWIGHLSSITEPIRRQGADETIEQMKAEGLGVPTKRRKITI